MQAHGLAPFPFAAAAWRDATPRIFGGTTLIHREFSARTGDPLWGAGFMLVPAPRADATVITMTTPATPHAKGEAAWHWLLGLAEELCDSIGADLGLINGFAVRRGGEVVGGTPAGNEVAPGHPPLVLCPWMYWSAARLVEDAILAGLHSVKPAAARSGPSPAGGWVLQAHADYSDAAPRQLLNACATAWKVQRLEWLGVR